MVRIYNRNSFPVQAVVSEDVAIWIRQKAKSSGLTVSAWIRQMLTEAAGLGPDRSLYTRIDDLEKRVSNIEHVFPKHLNGKTR
jgi:hypothetical protein